MMKRRSRWLACAAGLLLVLSVSGVAMGVTPPDAVPDPVVDTTATFEDIDGNGIDDDCQETAAVADAEAASAELLTVDVDADGVISTTEAAHSDRTGGPNCNHGGYVSWIAHQESADDADDDSAESDHAAIIAARLAAKAERDAARAAKRAEREAAHAAKRAEREAAHAAKRADRQASKAAKQAAQQAAKAARGGKGKNKSH